MVHHIAGGTYPGDPDPEPYFESLEGESNRLELEDKTPDGGRRIIALKSGRRLKTKGVPTKVKRGGPGLKRVPFVDIDSFWSCLFVSQKFRDILEELEPETHQFFPMDVFIKGEKVATYYWLNICNRLDTLHPTLCYPRDERGFWRPKKGEPSQGVFSKDAIGNHHAWHDKFTGGNFFSENFVKQIKDVGLTGAHLQHFPEA